MDIALTLVGLAVGAGGLFCLFLFFAPIVIRLWGWMITPHQADEPAP